MEAHWDSFADPGRFRFFSPEQVDRILMDGLRRGRKGSHAAIERVLKHETALPRAELWQRIRFLKHPAAAQPVRAVWDLEDERVLREGYSRGWLGKQKAVRELLARHPEWRPHIIWKHAAKLGLACTPAKRRPERCGLAWSEEDEGILLNLAGYKSARAIAKRLRRSETAVRTRLNVMGKSSRVHLEGFSRFALAKELHLSAKMIQRLIVEGLLEVRDPRITRESLDRYRRSGPGEPIERSSSEQEPVAAAGAGCGAAPLVLPAPAAVPASSSGAAQKSSRAKRVWAEAASSLNLPPEAVETLIARGVLQLYDARVTEKSLRSLCRGHGSLISCEFLSRETREWLQSTMDFTPPAGDPVALRMAPLRKHARIVRQCQKCGRSIRGNVFFRHIRRCARMRSEAKASP